MTNNKKVNKIKKQFLQGSLLVLISLILIFLGLQMLFSNLAAVVNFPKSGQLNVGQVDPGASLLNNFVKPDRLVSNVAENEKYFIIPGPHPELNEASFLASPDAQNFAYILRKENLESAAVNGQSGPSYDKIIFMRFSPDSKHFAYGVKSNNQEKVIIDNEEGENYDFIFSPYLFSPDSQYFIYKARRGSEEFMVLNQKPSRAYDKLYEVFLTSDKKKLVYFGLIGSQLWRTEIGLQEY